MIKNSTTEARLLRNGILSLKLDVIITDQIYKLSRTPNKTKTRVVKVNHDLLHIVLQSEQKFSLESTRKDGYAILVLHSGKKWRRALWLNAMHSGKK